MSISRPLRPLAALLCLSFLGLAHAAPPTDLIISEYIEGASFNKAIEIYNGTGAAIDLAAGQYRMEIHTNGAASASQSVALSGSLAAGATLVICNSGAAADILSACQVQNNSVANHNGDDAFVLRKSSTAIGVGTIVDTFGANTGDPGTSWGTGEFTSHDHTLRRKATICSGDVDLSNAFDPSVEWDSFAIGTHGGLGAHTQSCGDDAPEVTGNTPADGATGVLRNSNIEVTFSEDVTFDDSSVTLECPVGSPLAAMATGSPGATMTIDPAGDLPGLTTCRVTVLAGGIEDSADPPGNLAADHVFSFTTASAAPILSIDDVSQNEGDAGNTMTFTVSLDAPAPAMSSFTIQTTTPATATAGDDFVARTEAVVLPMGSMSYQFDVAINGDTDAEPDETFTVAVSDVVGLNVGDASAVGTLVNDDATPPPNLTIADVTDTEGAIGGKTFSFVATLDADPGMGTVSFDLSTADDSATDGDADYEPATTACSLTGTQRTCTLQVTVNGDLQVESDEQFLVDVENLAGAVGTVDAQALGIITNDDVATTPIGTIQGDQTGDADDASPMLGQSATVAGIVTARDATGSGGFWVQDAGDGDPNTSDALYVFEGSSHAALAVGNLVRVTGTVAEFFHLTQLSGALSITVLDAGVNALPAPVLLSAPGNVPSTTYPSNLERFENMRVSIPDFTVTAPNRNKTGGEFYGVLTGTPRPFREPGIPVEAEAPNPPPALPYAGPVFDNNPELLSVHNNLLTGSAALLVNAGTRLTGLVGVMDYSFEKFRVLPDVGSLTSANIVPGTAPSGTEVSDVAAGEFTVAAFNVQLLGATDPNCDPLVGTASQRAACRKLIKISKAIVENLKLPDILALIELGDFNPSPDIFARPALDALAAKVNADAVAAGEPDPQYVGLLTPAAETEAQATGFLIKTALSGGQPRVQLDGTPAEAVREYGRVDGADGLDNKMYCPDHVNPISNGRLLDRAPLVLKATVYDASGDAFPISVLNLHLKSLSDADSNEANTSDAGAGPERYSCPDEDADFDTLGERYRAKRQQGAEFVARLVEKLQTEDPDARLLVLGDLNAYEFNDGYADVLATIRGETYDGQDGAYADALTIVPDDGADLVTRNLSDLYVFSPADQWYSYTFDGHAQQLDHELANDQLLLHAEPIRIERPRINADFGQAEEDSIATPLRSSDHDPVVGFFAGVGFGSEPSIGAVPDQDTLEDTPAPAVAFSIAGALGCTTSVAASGVPALAAAAFDGDETDCEVELTPGTDVNGAVTVTLTVTDPDGDTDAAQMTLDVTPVNDAPSFVSGGDVAVAEDAGAVSQAWATSIAAGPANESAQAVSFEIVSNSNTPLFSDAGPVSVAPDGTLSFTPEAETSGSATIEVRIVDDGGTADGGVNASATQSFTITVGSANDDPTITAIGDVTTNENEAGQATFTLADVDSALACDSDHLSASSSNTGLLPLANITFSGNGNDCVATLTPVASQTGTSNVSITVNDLAAPTNGTATSNVFVFTAVENDADNDGVADAVDNCPATANPGQEDADGDDVGDACDSLNDPVRIFVDGFEGGD